MPNETDPRALAERFVTLMVSGDVERFSEVVAQNYRQHNPMVKQGLTGILEGAAWFRGVFPDLTVRIERLVVEGDFVAGYFTWSGTQRSELMGVPASGRVATWTSMDFWKVEHGKLAEHWDVVDWASLLEQLKAGGA